VSTIFHSIPKESGTCGIHQSKYLAAHPGGQYWTAPTFPVIGPLRPSTAMVQSLLSSGADLADRYQCRERCHHYRRVFTRSNQKPVDHKRHGLESESLRHRFHSAHTRRVHEPHRAVRQLALVEKLTFAVAQLHPTLKCAGDSSFTPSFNSLAILIEQKTADSRPPA
jgi:hypothetical protein